MPLAITGFGTAGGSSMGTTSLMSATSSSYAELYGAVGQYCSAIPVTRTVSPLRIFSRDRKSTRLNSSHANISYAVFCLKKKNTTLTRTNKLTIQIQAHHARHHDRQP